MPDFIPRSTAARAGRPVYAMLVSFPPACFVGAFVTDLAYWHGPAVLWETMSIWLLTAGLVVGAFAALAGLIDLLRTREARTRPAAWAQRFAYALALALSIVNAFVHSRDGYTAVVPTGLLLSGLVVLILVLTAWMGRRPVRRRPVGATA